MQQRRSPHWAPVCWFGAAAVFLTAVLPCGCRSNSSTGNDKPRVVTTVTMVSDLVRRVGGDTVEIQELMGPGIDPHVYKAKDSDRRKVDEADLILYNGLHLEGTMVRVLEDHPKAHAVAANIPREKLLIDAHSPDPHVWFDVSLWMYALDAVESELAKLVPAQAAQYKENAAVYRKELAALHEEVKKETATIPRDRRVLITSHDAFRYFGRAYDLQVMGLQGVSTADEAGLKRVREIVDFVCARKIKALFPETSVPADGINKVIDECRSRGCNVKRADGELFSDAMDSIGKPGGTYPGMIRANMDLIVRNLK